MKIQQLHSYQHFCDSVVRKVSFDYGQDRAASRLEVDLEAQNPARGGKWELVRITCRGVKSWKFMEGRSTVQIVYFLNVQEQEGSFWLDFDGFEDRPIAAADLERSHFYCISAEVSLTTLEELE